MNVQEAVDIRVANEAVECARPGVIAGTDGADNLVGTEGDDVICSGAGNDVIRGLGGNDTVVGGPGDDDIDGGNGDDRLYGDAGIDTIHGGEGTDFVFSGVGDDIADGDGGDDQVYGEYGNDSLTGGSGEDLVAGGAGNDALFGGLGNDDLTGGEGIDTADGGPARDLCTESEQLVGCETLPALAPAGLVIPASGVPGVQLEVQSPGGISSENLYVETIVDPSITPGGPIVELTNSSSVPFSTARLTLPVWGPGPITDYSIYTKGEETGLWELVEGEQLRNSSTGTISVSLNHFSPYTVLANLKPVTVAPRSLVCIDNSAGAEVSVAILIDSSGSADEWDPSDSRVAAAEYLLEVLPVGSKASVYAFDDTPTEIFSGRLTPTGFASALTATSNTDFAFGGTATTKALRLVFGDLNQSSPQERYRAVFLISDGDVTENAADIQAIASLAATKSIPLHLIDLWGFDSSQAITQLSEATGGFSAGALRETLSRQKAIDVANEITKRVFDLGEDKDGDGLTDCEETNGLLVVDPKAPEGTFTLQKSNFEKRDQDDDGLIDGLEFKRFEPSKGSKPGARIIAAALETYLRTPAVKLSSIQGPTAKNSDGDHLTDWEEVVHGTDPLKPDKKGSEGVWLGGKSLVDHYLSRWECDESIFGLGGRTCTFAERETKLRNRFIKDLKGYSAFQTGMENLPIENLATLVLRLTVAEVDIRTGSSGLEAIGSMSREERKSSWTAAFVLTDVIDPIRAAKSLENLANFLLPIGIGLLVIAAAIVLGPAVARAGGAVARLVFEGAKESAIANGAQGAALWVWKLTKIPVGFSLNSLALGSIGCSFFCPDEVDDAIDAITGGLPDADDLIRKYDDDVIGVVRRLDGDNLPTDLIRKIEFDGRKVIAPGPAEFNEEFVDRFGNSQLNRIIADENPLDLKGRPLQLSELDGSTTALVPLEGVAAVRGCSLIGVAVGFGRFGAILQAASPSTCRAGVKTPTHSKIPRGDSAVYDGLNSYVKKVYQQTSTTTQRLWTLGPAARGYIIESFLCPQYGVPLKYAFKTMDCIVRDGDGLPTLLTNIKSINLRSRTYKDPVKLEARLQSILSKTIEFKSYKDVEVNSRTVKQIHIAIPKGVVDPAIQRVLDAFAAKSTSKLQIVVQTTSF